MTTGQAARHYRQRRWWPDQALWDRYATVAARSPQGLAVVDDRGATLTHAALRARGRAGGRRPGRSGHRAG
ncbi:MAG: hypothetical protein V9E89_08760 [Ilumatobacteraceae bacterium]